MSKLEGQIQSQLFLSLTKTNRKTCLRRQLNYRSGRQREKGNVFLSGYLLNPCIALVARKVHKNDIIILQMVKLKLKSKDNFGKTL